MDSRKTSLEALPQELYDTIFDLTFTTPTVENAVVKDYKLGQRIWKVNPTGSTNIRIVDRTYKPPKLLQINRATRERFATRYHSNSVFSVHEEILEYYLHSLPLKHISYMTEVRMLMDRYFLENNLPQQVREARTMIHWNCQDLSDEIISEINLGDIIKFKIICEGRAMWFSDAELADPAFWQQAFED